MTGPQYGCVISPSLKNLEQQFAGIHVRAIHDDTTILGDTETIFKAGGAREQLAKDLSEVGSELHTGKAEAYGLTPADRAQIPVAIKQPSKTWADPETGAIQEGYGIIDCGIPVGDDAFVLAACD